MLQQTRAERVMSKFEPFISRFPDFRALAGASPGEVLAAWQGLGYNRRALSLWKLAIRVEEDFGGVLPDDERDLRDLPGVGPYTAAAVLVFAFNRPVVLIETNVRRVYLHCFFSDRDGVPDTEIRPLVSVTMDRKNPRDWYNALMDYGAFLSALPENPNKRSRHYQRQSPFEGSVRQVRGAILKVLVGCGEVPEKDLIQEIEQPPAFVHRALSQLEREGFLETKMGIVRIAGSNREKELSPEVISKQNEE
jgi:A/G-specific adenine glycosylase